jgi:hypothetical protein
MIATYDAGLFKSPQITLEGAFPGMDGPLSGVAGIAAEWRHICHANRRPSTEMDLPQPITGILADVA